MFQLSRSHHTVDLKPVQPVGDLSQLGGAFQGVSLVHHSLHALSMSEGLSSFIVKRRENLT
ncbi:MAG: hypothetical protein CMH89_11845 [Oceanicaulis sp.]|uniref:hypothetical protein n=1 Tax=Oceanicaulis sp. TaxID=1924941 RepID=UPI000C515BE2|nr:hypothetical protein [Oceanicaulis sp.]MAB70305.1 hypothetical protein [Oceanicaulis sp.]HBU60824.1 hypothetical protein [Oceanicaulis sp.]|tara:strand:- start:116 stop:298 length:183 start_codon:yes stop_codon:yes gene_type:complete